MESIKINSNEIVLLGTSHISPKSVKDINNFVQKNNPDIICIELDKNRAIGLFQKGKRKYPLSLIKRIGFSGYVFALIGSYIEKKIASKIGTKVGDDMKAGILSANKHKIPVAFIDQNIEITLRRFSKLFTFKQKLKLFWFIIKSFFTKQEKIAFDITGVPEQDQIDKIIEMLKPNVPVFYNVLIEERNVFMVNKILRICKKEQDKLILCIIG
ncbi:hypothetical protein HOK68_02045, partial [Candidatus Woesearchaeota archaeon]|nr:hypothetical protein [Candidatus Woesearchaeota archaeon]